MIRCLCVILFLFVFVPVVHAGGVDMDEQAARERLRVLLKQAGTDGVDVKGLTPLDTTRIVLEHNLAIKDSELDRLTAEQALREAQSLFDPRLSASAAYSNSLSYYRETETYKYLKNTVTFAGPNPVYVLYDDTSPVKYLRFDRERVAGYYLRDIKASDPPPWGNVESKDYSLGLGTDIPWGPGLNLTMNVREKKNFWKNDDGSWGDYKRPWRSAFNESLTLPLPFTKDFGPYSSRDTEVKLAKVMQDVADWSAKDSANNALLEGELAYWDLVVRLQNLLALDRHNRNLKSLLDKTHRLYDDRLCTEYDLALVKSAYTRSVDGMEQGAAAYRTASNRLAELTDAGSGTLFFPKGYAVLADLPLSPIPGEDNPEDVSGNPSYGRQLASVALAEIEEKHRSNQTLPDLSASQSLTLTQGYSNFGYADPGRSMNEVFTNPDMVRQDYGLWYTYPLFNRAANASHGQAMLDAREERTRARQLENSLRRTAADALTMLEGARRRVTITAKGVELARAAYRKALDMQSDREITEYEILSKSSNQLTAELAYINARMDCQKAAARFQAALGAYQERYATRDGGES